MMGQMATRKHNPKFKPQSAVLNKKQVCQRLGRSQPWFDNIRPQLEQRGFPRKDSLLGGWLVAAVERWISKRSNTEDEETIGEKIALERISAETATQIH